MSDIASSTKFGRGLFVACCAALLGASLATAIVTPQGALQEGVRTLAIAPALPQTWDQLVHFPKQADIYFKDHFGLRLPMVKARTILYWNLLHELSSVRIVPGSDDRIIYSDSDAPFRTGTDICGATLQADSWRQNVMPITVTSLRRFIKQIPDFLVIAIPSTYALYTKNMPLWLQQACANRVQAVNFVKNELPSDLQERIYYPQDSAAALPENNPLIPKHNFHWLGSGPDLLMTQIAEKTLHLKRQMDLKWKEITASADLDSMLPGVELSNKVRIPDFRASNVEVCQDASCFKEPFFAGMPVPILSSHFSRPGAGGRLLLFCDSFGFVAASSLIQYYSDIVIINVNNIQQLNEDGKKILWQRLVHQWHPDRVLMLIYDGNISGMSRFANIPMEN